ncbi:hypothetical protein A2U01_0006849, partial [Trifolium medium]|nr:hypothetical protein [Trifolium medium]
MGDFNDLLSNEDKRSRVEHTPWRIRGFRSAVQDSNLVDLPLIGYPFTWVRGRGGDDVKEERLDRAMATQAWYDTFPNCQLHNLVADRSDHYPILLKLYESNRRKTMRDFKFENSWLQEEALEGVVQAGWEKDGAGGLMERLQNCTNEMNDWGRQLHNKYRVEIEECRRELEFLRDTDQHLQGQRYEEVQKRMSILLAQEEAFWKQRAKIYRLHEGDTNSRFFHATTSVKRKRNKITKLQNNEGEVVQNQLDICGVAKNYFEQLFSMNQNNSGVDIEYIMPSITNLQNDKLIAPFQIREFKEALFAMHSDKAPGPDGLNPAFFKRFWDLCGVELFTAGVEWLERGSLPDQIMHDYKYCPYSEEGEPRINERLVAHIAMQRDLQNNIKATEIIHHMKCKTRGKMGEVALKVDISKAYDRVEWDYMKIIMTKMGFHDKWVNWMSMCMESVHYQVL